LFPLEITHTSPLVSLGLISLLSPEKRKKKKKKTLFGSHLQWVTGVTPSDPLLLMFFVFDLIVEDTFLFVLG